MTSRGLSGIAVFTFMRMICKFFTLVLRRTFKGVDELNLDLEHVHEWAAANGFKLNPIRSQVTLISRFRVDISPPTLLIGSNVIKDLS
jgi:hypothetical protein